MVNIQKFAIAGDNQKMLGEALRCALIMTDNINPSVGHTKIKSFRSDLASVWSARSRLSFSRLDGSEWDGENYQIPVAITMLVAQVYKWLDLPEIQQTLCKLRQDTVKYGAVNLSPNYYYDYVGLKDGWEVSLVGTSRSPLVVIKPHITVHHYYD